MITFTEELRSYVNTVVGVGLSLPRHFLLLREVLSGLLPNDELLLLHYFGFQQSYHYIFLHILDQISTTGKFVRSTLFAAV